MTQRRGIEIAASNEGWTFDGLMLDTNIFNLICDGKVSLEVFDGQKLFCTYVQYDELCQTRDLARREALIEAFRKANVEWVPTQTALCGSPVGMAGVGSGEMYTAIMDRVGELDRASGKRHSIFNHSNDGLIVEAAICFRHALVTNDANLRVAAMEWGCAVVSLSGLIDHSGVR
jgi:hypothetical protein